MTLHLPPGGVDAHRRRGYGDELEKTADGSAVRLADGPYVGSVFYASTETYDAFHTCNTWTALVLRDGGLPVDTQRAVRRSGHAAGVADRGDAGAQPSDQHGGAVPLGQTDGRARRHDDRGVRRRRRIAAAEAEASAKQKGSRSRQQHGAWQSSSRSALVDSAVVDYAYRSRTTTVASQGCVLSGLHRSIVPDLHMRRAWPAQQFARFAAQNIGRLAAARHGRPCRAASSARRHRPGPSCPEARRACPPRSSANGSDRARRWLRLSGTIRRLARAPRERRPPAAGCASAERMAPACARPVNARFARARSTAARG